MANNNDKTPETKPVQSPYILGTNINEHCSANSDSQQIDSSKALVVFSGGQDSTTCLYWAFEIFGKGNVETVTFDYGQKHRIELESAEAICKLAGVDFDLVDVRNILRSTSSLTSNKVVEQHEQLDDFATGVPETFVPGRNILFLTIAANIALSKNCAHIVTGVCETDFAGYYDCRQDFVLSLEQSLNLGLFGKTDGLKIYTPLMNLSKAETVKLAASLHNQEECFQALALSHTCYQGQRPPCGTCHACHLRARGFEEAGVPDPICRTSSKVSA